MYDHLYNEMYPVWNMWWTKGRRPLAAEKQAPRALSGLCLHPSSGRLTGEMFSQSEVPVDQIQS
jgi:hypothetical protein